MGKIYAVKKGIKPGKYYTWDECKEQVNVYKGAEYKSFKTEEEADRYLGLVKDVEPTSGTVIYVDGSYNAKNMEYACGVIIIKNDLVLETLSEKGGDIEAATMRNVAGEILGATLAMKYCIEHGISEVDIHHDYTGIAFWCTGEWQAKNKFTQEYKRYYESIKDKLKVNFKKVVAHSNNKYNDMADEAAKKLIF